MYIVHLYVQEGEGVHSISSEVGIDHFCEIHEKSGHEKCTNLEYFEKKLNIMNSTSFLVCLDNVDGVPQQEQEHTQL